MTTSCAGSVGETRPEPLGPDWDQSGSGFVCGEAEFQGEKEDQQLQTGFWTVVTDLDLLNRSRTGLD